MLRLLLPVFLLLALVGASVLSDRPMPRADFVFINRGDVNTLDPQRMSWMQDLRVARLIFEGLVQNDVLSDDYAIIPAIAESWTVSEDGLTYTFHLRDNARWTNGSPVTAQDFRFTWRRALLPDLASDYVGMFLLIRGAQDFYDWREQALNDFGERQFPSARARAEAADELWEHTKDRFDEMVALTAPDPLTLVVELERPIPYFLDLCAFAVFYPVYGPLVSQFERPDPVTARLMRRPGWTKPGVLISNGPFELVRWRFKRDMRLEANDLWWNRESLAIESIDIPSVNDPNAVTLAFQTGSVDWVSDVTAAYRGDLLADKLDFYREHAEEYERLKAKGLDPYEIDRRLPEDPRKHIKATPAFGVYFYNFNCRPILADGRPNPFHDARVRRAFAMCIDKQAIVDEVRRLGESVAHTLIPPGSIGGYTGPQGIPHIGQARNEAEREAIAQEARALLEEADFPPNFVVELLFNTDGGHDLIAQAIAKNWQEYLGVQTRLTQKEIKIFREDLKNHRFITARAGWYGDYGDPTTFLNINQSQDGNNDRAYSNPEFDALLDRAAAELDPAERMAILAEAERMLVEEEFPLVPIFIYNNVQLFDSARVTGLTAHPRSKNNLYLIDILGDGKGPDKPRPMRPARSAEPAQ
ncbi:MAG: peptide ABC transporter substrate-binding protein [Phycisphaerales bacterium]|nr:peptide ABC transporter substrate-binding protein [Planctomycetota bacterium]MCH8507548.1 peptide ABC transporter substrate-binding protein [Phycisphaerales bacterium]